MFTSIFDEVQNPATAITEPTQAGAAVVAPLSFAAQSALENEQDKRIQRVTNILQGAAALIAIIYFINSFFKK